MELYQIRYFLAVVDTGSFSRAAERVFVSQPTLSAGVKKLEQELGQQLLNRSTRQIALSDAGTRFLPRARTIIYECNAAQLELSTNASERRLQIGVLRSVPHNRLASLLVDYGARHPDIQVFIKEGSIDQVASWLDEGRIDTAITTVSSGSDGQAHDLLYRWRYLLAVPDGHRFAARASIAINALNRLAFIHRTHSESGGELTRTFANLGVNPRIVYRTDQDDKAMAYVAAGIGLCMVPDYLAQPGVALVPVDKVQISRSIGLIGPQGGYNDIAKAFQLFATSHDWKPREGSARHLEWAR